MSRKTYTTRQIADLTGVHPNTVRLYEAWGFLARVGRRPNNYRVFNDQHLQQMTLARLALPGPYPLDGRIVQALVREFARDNISGSLVMAREYLDRVAGEKSRAQAALAILDNWFEHKTGERHQVSVTGRKQAAVELWISPDALRTWERNGLFSIARDAQGQLAFSSWDMEKISVIRLLRNCGYTISSLLRVFGNEEKLQEKPSLLLALPDHADDFFYITDMFMEYLDGHLERANRIIAFITPFADDPVD